MLIDVHGDAVRLDFRNQRSRFDPPAPMTKCILEFTTEGRCGPRCGRALEGAEQASPARVARSPRRKPIDLAREICEEQQHDRRRQRRLDRFHVIQEVADRERPHGGDAMAQLRDESIAHLQQRDP
jgi:hypothetical protein